MITGFEYKTVISIHPGKFKDTAGLWGRKIHERVIELRDQYLKNLQPGEVYDFQTGITIHFVLPTLKYDDTCADSIIHEKVIPVDQNETVDDLERRIKKIEWGIYPDIIEEVLSV